MPTSTPVAPATPAPVTPATIYEYADQFRASLLAEEIHASTTMVAHYFEVHQAIKDETDKIIKRLKEGKAAGSKAGDMKGLQIKKGQLKELEDQVMLQIARFGEKAEVLLTTQQKKAVQMAVAHSSKLAQTALGTPPPGVSFGAVWQGLPTKSVEALLGHLAPKGALYERLASMGFGTLKAVRHELAVGLSLGRSSRQIAARIATTSAMQLTTAQTWARTETFRAYREASRLTYEQNSDVVKGWQWMSALNSRCCAMCVAMHGTMHQANERMASHPNCRCIMIPVTVGWKTLMGYQGNTLKDTRPDKMVEGPAWFKSQPEETQRSIMGPAAHNAYKAGVINLPDLVGFRQSKEWGPSRYTRSLSQVLQGGAAGVFYQHAPKDLKLNLADVKKNLGMYWQTPQKPPLPPPLPKPLYAPQAPPAPAYKPTVLPATLAEFKKLSATQQMDLLGQDLYVKWKYKQITWTATKAAYHGNGKGASWASGAAGTPPVFPQPVPKVPTKPNSPPATFAGTSAQDHSAAGFKLFASGEEGDKWARSAFDTWKTSLTKDEQSGIKSYQGTTYRWLNAKLRGKPPPYGTTWTQDYESKTKTYTKKIDSALSKGRVAENIVTYRGFSDSRITNNAVWGNIVGAEIQDEGYTSTSFSHRTAENFASKGNPERSIFAEIRIPQGTRAGYASLVHEIGEKELLLARGTRFRVLKAEQRAKYRYLLLEVIPDGS